MHRSDTAPRSASGVPLTRTDRRLIQVVRDLVAVRPVNWEDSTDPQQRRAWQAADRALGRIDRRPPETAG